MLVLISVSSVSAVDVDDNNDTIVSSADAEALAVENDVGTIDDLSEDVAGGDDVALANDAKSVAVGKSNENDENILAMANPNSDDVLSISIQSDSTFPSEITPGEQFSFYVHTDMPALKLVKLTFADGTTNSWDITTGPRQTLFYNYTGQITGATTVTVYVEGNDGTHDDKKFDTTIIASTPAASVSVNNSTLDLFVDDTFTIVATTVPDGLNVTFVG